MRSRQWYPLNSDHQWGRPEKDQLVALQHAVWRVIKTMDSPLTDADRDVWLAQGMPDIDTWHQRPYQVVVEWVGGAPPKWATNGDDRKRGTVTVPANAHRQWHVYPSGRWPQCSCCGEPMPCRAELEDRLVGASLDRIAKLEAIPVGACWSCNEPITSRQQSVTYPGENIYLPGGPQICFHTRQKCASSAHLYEEKWVAADPRRERILTWPACTGSLIIHGDGSSECFGGLPECHGHDTHDHTYLSACYLQSHGCPRECAREGHPGTRTTPRPPRPEPSVGQPDATIPGM